MAPKNKIDVDATIKLIGLSDRLREGRQEAELTQGDVGRAIAKAINRKRPYTAAAVGQWELGEADPGLDVVLAFARLTNIEVGWLMTGVGPKRLVGERGRIVRKLSTAQALAVPINYESDETAHTHFPCSDKAFALGVSDGRNEPDLREGLDQVVVDPAERAQPGDIVFAQIDSEAVLGKLVRSKDGAHVIEAVNPDWHDEKIRAERGDRVVGTVTEQARRRRTGFSQ